MDCEQCGVAFIRRVGKTKGKKKVRPRFCTRVCYRAFHDHQKATEPRYPCGSLRPGFSATLVKVCVQCGKDFTPPSGTAWRRCCSQECSNTRRRELNNVTYANQRKQHRAEQRHHKIAVRTAGISTGLLA